MSTMSPTPGTPQTSDKAKWAGIVSGALTFVASILAYWIADADPFTSKEFGEAVLIAAVTAGVIGGGTGAATHSVTNKPKRKVVSGTTTTTEA